MSKQVTVEVADHAVEMFGGDEVCLGREMYEAAVVEWFDEGRISQGNAAELLGLSRAELFDVLWQHKVSPIQVTPEELTEELQSV